MEDYEMKNDEIWSILKYEDKIIFQAFASWFVFDGKETAAHRSSEIFLFFSEFGGRIWAHSETSGPVTVDIVSGNMAKVPDVPFGSSLVCMLPWKDKALAVTYSDGLFLYDGLSFEPFRTDADDMLRTALVNRAAVSEDGLIVIGTLLQGAVAISGQGRKMWSVNSLNALDSDTVLGMSFDRDGNLWMALDSGISMVSADSPMRYAGAFLCGL